MRRTSGNWQAAECVRYGIAVHTSTRRLLLRFVGVDAPGVILCIRRGRGRVAQRIGVKSILLGCGGRAKRGSYAVQQRGTTASFRCWSDGAPADRPDLPPISASSSSASSSTSQAAVAPSVPLSRDLRLSSRPSRGVVSDKTNSITISACVLRRERKRRAASFDWALYTTADSRAFITNVHVRREMTQSRVKEQRVPLNLYAKIARSGASCT